jgi:predicted dehydrogenase
MRDPLRIGVIGAGNIARAHLPTLMDFPDRFRVTAVCDIDQSRGRAFGGESDATVYTDALRMIAEAKLDAVDICTTHDQHARHAVAAAEAGKHVFVEKPMACSVAECRAMVDAAESAGVVLMVGQYQRFVPEYRAVRELIDAGELGPIRAVRIDTMQSLTSPRVADYYPPGHWLFDGVRAGGGIVISVSVHKLDLARYLVGDIARVTAWTRGAAPEFVNGAEDYAVALLEFENGALGELFGTYSGFLCPWTEQFTLFGESGSVYGLMPALGADAPAMVASTRRSPDAFVPVPVSDSLPTDNGIANELLHFADCCATGEAPLSSGRDNLGTMRAVFAIYESARTGAPVELADL